MRRRRRGPGLLGMAARTAVVAGTATAVSGKVAQAQHARAAQAAPPAPEPEPVAVAPGSGGLDLDQLERVVALHAQGALDDAEFAAAKQRIITGS
jgi:hypothetical protein